MPTPAALLARLDEIGLSLKNTGQALALIGLGSVGLEVERLDAYSDLDFFAIVEAGFKARFIEQLDWLSSVCPIAYAFRNTPDGYKLLFEDGIFCEFAAFEQPELSAIPFERGRIVWKQAHIEEAVFLPAAASSPRHSVDTAWLLGEALTNLYVGLGRFWRGEKLSAARFIQNLAVDRILELASLVEQDQGSKKDRFAPERRFEQRFPRLAQELPRFVQGYERSCESAEAILIFLERHFEVNPAMSQAIRQLIAGPGETA